MHKSQRQHSRSLSSLLGDDALQSHFRNSSRALDKREYLVIGIIFVNFCIKTYVVIPHLTRLVETVQMSSHIRWFQLRSNKNYHQILPLIKNSAQVKKIPLLPHWPCICHFRRDTCFRNSSDPVQTLQNAMYDQGLYCLHRNFYGKYSKNENIHHKISKTTELQIREGTEDNSIDNFSYFSIFRDN